MPVPASSTPARRPGREALFLFAATTAVAALLYRLPALGPYFHTIIAALFLYLPAMVLWRQGRELDDYGLRARPLGHNLALVGLAVAVFFPPFGLGFIAWHKLACATPLLHPLALGPCIPGSLFERFTLRAPLDPWWQAAAAELLVVALPEEFFFRGYLQGRLAEVWPARRHFLGAPVGAALLVSAALFALCHLAVQANPGTLAVFFPGLVFGWMRARTRSILAGTIFHALCNLYIETLHRSFFG